MTQTWTITQETFTGLAQMISGPAAPKNSVARCGSRNCPDRSPSLASPALSRLSRVLSVNLGLINLFPVPVLDGGHLVFYLAEALRGRPLPQRAQEYGFRAGLAFLACLFVFATWNDLTHLGLFRWVAEPDRLISARRCTRRTASRRGCCLGYPMRHDCTI